MTPIGRSARWPRGPGSCTMRCVVFVWRKRDRAARALVMTDDDHSGRDLSRCRLYDLDLRGKNFAGANLDRADPTASDLRGADLSGANLCAAFLTGAQLDGADLRHARLDGAYLTSIHRVPVRPDGRRHGSRRNVGPGHQMAAELQTAEVRRWPLARRTQLTPSCRQALDTTIPLGQSGRPWERWQTSCSTVGPLRLSLASGSRCFMATRFCHTTKPRSNDFGPWT